MVAQAATLVLELPVPPQPLPGHSPPPNHPVHVTINALNLPAAGPTLLPPPSSPPDCYLCGAPSRQERASPSNPNGNENRPYYKCTDFDCPTWLVFNDERGNLPDNPTCDCNASSKMQAACPKKNRALHFVCRLGTCNYFLQLVNSEGRRVCVDTPTFYELRRRGYL